MRVLMVVPYFGGAKDGNPDVVDLAAELKRKGHEIAVLTTRCGNDAGYEEFLGIKVYRTVPMLSVSNIDYSVSVPLPTLYRLIRKHDVDIVHGVMEFGTQTLTAAAVSSFLRKPFVLTIQGAVTTFGSAHVDALFSLFDKAVVRSFSFMPKRVIILSQRLSERAKQIGVAQGKIRVIPSGVHSEDEFNPGLYERDAMRKELGLQDKILLGFVGRLVPLKGLFYLLCALKSLQKEHPNLHLIIVGDGPERAVVEHVADKFRLNITMTGWIKRSEIARFISAMDIFVNPSLTEGLPIAVMEAMAMQKPVIATSVGGTQDLVKDGESGFLVPPYDVSALASSIDKLAPDADLQWEFGLVGRSIIQRDFSFDTIVEKVVQVYEEAVS